MPLVVGVDESGTGSWAGPFHVGAVAVDVLAFNREVGRYLRDSKKLSDVKRRKAVPLIKEHAVVSVVVEMGVFEIDQGPQRAWRLAISRALHQMREALRAEELHKPTPTLLIDGPRDAGLVKILKSVGWYHPRFEVEGDTKFPAIMAAAILAKTARNDVMVGLASEFPEYGWERNSGYGTPEHRRMCEEHGVTQHHRRIKRLKKCKGYRPKGEWFDAESYGSSEVG
jgi:ribonuclease HII